MDKISLHHTLPNVFKDRTDIKSDVWQKDIAFEKGKTYLVEAMSGTGKSSLCSYIIGYRNDYSGKIEFDGEDISSFSVNKWTTLRQTSLSHVFQELRLFPELTAYENIQIKNNLTGFKDESQIKEWFERLGIIEKWKSKVGIMSFGQQQRVAMIRALVQPFDFILADEPISHLDDSNSNIMCDIMLEEAKRQGAGVIITSIGKHVEINYDQVLHL